MYLFEKAFGSKRSAGKRTRRRAELSNREIQHMNPRFSRLTALLFCIEVATATASAQGILINGSFESGPGGSNPVYAGGTELTGWTVESGSVDSVEGYQSPDGLMCVDLDGYYS